MFDTARYYAFVLEAQARFGHEGAHFSPLRIFAAQKRRKPQRQLIEKVARRMTERGLAGAAPTVLEFGVYNGRSINILSRLFEAGRLYGFDTFTGFPDDGRADWQLDFRVAGMPQVGANVELVPGRFEDTLALFVAAHPNELAELRLVHVDCDIFSAAHCVFEALDEFIVPGCVIVFDELLNYDEFAENELLAFYLFLARRGLDFEWFVTTGKAWPFGEACAGRQPAGAFAGYREQGCYQNTSVIITAASDATRSRLDPFLPLARELVNLRDLRQLVPAPRPV
jgi:SAM-dependent methyltransferase